MESKMIENRQKDMDLFYWDFMDGRINFFKKFNPDQGHKIFIFIIDKCIENEDY